MSSYGQNMLDCITQQLESSRKAEKQAEIERYLMQQWRELVNKEIARTMARELVEILEK